MIFCNQDPLNFRTRVHRFLLKIKRQKLIGQVMSIEKKKRAIILINDMYYTGGTNRVAVNMLRDLAPYFEMTLLSVEPLKNSVFASQDLNFHSLNARRNRVQGYFGAGRIKTYLDVSIDMIAVGMRLRRYVKKNKIDIVFAFWYDLASFAAVFLPKNVIKIGCEHISYSEPGRFWKQIRTWCYPYLDAVVSPTEHDRNLYNRFSKRVAVIPNAVPSQSIEPFENRERVILSIGSFIYRKGIDRLLWALKMPLLENPDWRLVIVGGGEKTLIDSWYVDYVASLIQLLGIEKQVEFHPTTKKIENYYRRSAFYVMGSRVEGLAMVLLEAKSFGLPVISFNCPTGPADIVRDGIDGYIIENDTIDYSDAVRKLIEDKNLRQKMGEAAADDIRQRFSSNIVALQWVDLVDSIQKQSNTDNH